MKPGLVSPTLKHLCCVGGSPVNLRVLAVDFDGTIAFGDTLHPDAAEAIRAARAAGVIVILATGRILSDLDALLPRSSPFDVIVAENGAVLRLPGQPTAVLLGRSPDPRFLAGLTHRGIRHRSGDCVVEAEAAAAPGVLDAIREHNLPLGITFNRGRLMALPLGVTKGSGLSEALWRLRASGHNALAIGDGENDHPLFDACEFGAAVEWGSATLKQTAEAVIPGRDPGAVASYIRSLLTKRRLPQAHRARRWIRLGTRADGQPMDIGVRGRNFLIGGDPMSGKSWINGLLCEQLILQRYSLCILDPEGDYRCLEALPGVIVHQLVSGDVTLSTLERVLTRPDLSLVVDMSGAAPADKPALARRVLELTNRLRRETGLPHRVVVDEAHYFFGRLDDPALFDRELGGYSLVSYRISDLSAQVLEAAEAVFVTRVADQRQAMALRDLCSPAANAADWQRTLANLAIDEALLLPGATESPDRLEPFKIGPRITSHVRHRQKYCEVPVWPGHEFVVTRDGQPTGQRAFSLTDLLSLLPRVPDGDLRGHLVRGDLHRWVERVFGDGELGAAIRGFESLDVTAARASIISAVADRYLVQGAPADQGSGD